jgi:coenzyme F420 hydrogenase subunit beta
MEVEIENFIPLMKPSKGFSELKKTVIDQGICSGCSNCAAFCERIIINEDGIPELEKDCNLEIGAVKCSTEGTCYDCCPMVSYSKQDLEQDTFGSVREDEDLGFYQKLLAVRSKKKEILERAQDGGAVTAILAAALKSGLIGGAIVANRMDNWKTEAQIARTPEELMSASGTKYTRTPTAMKFGKMIREIRNLALVGTGCQIAGARRAMHSILKDVVEKTKESERPLDLTLIGLFCFENFPYPCISKALEREFGVNLEDIVKTDITKGKFIITKKDGEELSVSVKKFNECVPESCNLCIDFTAEFSDLTAGSIGTETGWSTVIVRSEKGMKLVEKALELGYIETKDEVDVSQIKKNVSLKKKKREATAESRNKEGKYVPEYK